MQETIIKNANDPHFLSQYLWCCDVTGIVGAYLAGAIDPPSNDSSLVQKKRIAVDFKSAFGPMSKVFPELGYDTCCGVVSTDEILSTSFDEIVRCGQNDNVFFRLDAPDYLYGKCDLVTAIHTHDLCETPDNLEQDIFCPISKLLSATGEAVVLGCPTSHISHLSVYRHLSIGVDNVPAEIQARTTQPDRLKDESGFIALRNLPSFVPEDGTPLSQTLQAVDADSITYKATSTITFWSEAALINASGKCGLELIKQRRIIIDRSPRMDRSMQLPHYYVALHFKKSSGSANPPLIP